jgi:hypothetical protein
MGSARRKTRVTLNTTRPSDTPVVEPKPERKVVTSLRLDFFATAFTGAQAAQMSGLRAPDQ